MTLAAPGAFVRRHGVAAWRMAGALAIGCLLGACVVAPPRELDAAANDTRVVLEPKQELVVRLDANPTTGCRWAADRGATSVLTEVDPPSWAPVSTSAPLVGMGGWTTFRYRAVALGTDTLELAYRRPSEKDVAPVRTFHLEVVVSKP